ncbi:hypothetical protein DFH27DRAFT_641743 [Peziza echinospora]|nr:hypothetical protein DFH27DRAFT_641743 [Peziza echinospora]
MDTWKPPREASFLINGKVETSHNENAHNHTPTDNWAWNKAQSYEGVGAVNNQRINNYYQDTSHSGPHDTDGTVEIVDWLCELDFSLERWSKCLDECVEGIGYWFRRSKELKAWLNREIPFFVLPGNPRSGKDDGSAMHFHTRLSNSIESTIKLLSSLYIIIEAFHYIDHGEQRLFLAELGNCKAMSNEARKLSVLATTLPVHIEMNTRRWSYGRLTRRLQPWRRPRLSRGNGGGETSKEDILNWICDERFQFDWYEKRSEVLHNRHDSIGEWFHDCREFSQWVKREKKLLHVEWSSSHGNRCENEVTALANIYIDRSGKKFKEVNTALNNEKTVMADRARVHDEDRETPAQPLYQAAANANSDDKRSDTKICLFITCTSQPVWLATKWRADDYQAVEVRTPDTELESFIGKGLKGASVGIDLQDLINVTNDTGYRRKKLAALITTKIVAATLHQPHEDTQSHQ